MTDQPLVLGSTAGLMSPLFHPRSGFYDDPYPTETSGTTEGEAILEWTGFVDSNGEAFEYVWVWYTVGFCIGCCIVSCLASVYFLNTVRFATGGSLGGSEGGSEGEEEEEVVSAEKISASAAGVGLEAKGATLTFRDVNYIVKASTSDDKLHLLKGINGYFAKGKLTALMGSSGGAYFATAAFIVHHTSCLHTSFPSPSKQLERRR